VESKSQEQPEMPSKPTFAEILEAQRMLSGYFRPTPLVRAPGVSQPGVDAFLKLETHLPTGSFKPRGALFALAQALASRKVAEVTASSTGNHGAAVAWAAKTLAVPATIFLPANPNPVKRKKIADLGARIVEVGGLDITHASAEALDYSSRTGAYFLNDATDPVLPAGPGTIGLEVLSQLPSVRAVYVPMGDTALIRGIGAAIKAAHPHVKIVGVQAERAPSYYLSWKEGKPVEVEIGETCADGLATKTAVPENVHAIRELVDDVALAAEEQLLAAIRLLYEREKVVAEPAGAAAAAAFLEQPPGEGPVVLVVSGANISDAVRARAGLPAG
jgi:threonine dehydratase